MDRLRLAIHSFGQLDGEDVARLAHREFRAAGASVQIEVDHANAGLHVEHATTQRRTRDFQHNAPERKHKRIARFAARRHFLEEAEETRLVAPHDRVGDVGVALLLRPAVSAAMVPEVAASDGEFEGIAAAPCEHARHAVREAHALLRRLVAGREQPFQRLRLLFHEIVPRTRAQNPRIERVVAPLAVEPDAGLAVLERRHDALGTPAGERLAVPTHAFAATVEAGTVWPGVDEPTVASARRVVDEAPAGLVENDPTGEGETLRIVCLLHDVARIAGCWHAAPHESVPRDGPCGAGGVLRIRGCLRIRDHARKHPCVKKASIQLVCALRSDSERHRQALLNGHLSLCAQSEASQRRCRRNHPQAPTSPAADFTETT